MTGAPPDPVVSVVMANRDAGPFIAEAVRSVLGQSVRELELILVDDASSDDSAARARAAGLGDPRLRMVSLPRSVGPGGARNRALAEARGGFVAIVDSDDAITPDRFERLLALAEAEDADLVADNLLQFSAEGDQGPLLDGPRWTRPRQVGLVEFVGSNRMYAQQANLGYLKPMIRRAVLSRVASGYDEGLRVGEDYDLVARLLAAGARYWVDPVVRYRYRRHGGSISHRLLRTDIEALLAADDRFRRLDSLTAAELAALDRRRRTLKRALGFDSFVAALKAGSPLRALNEAAADPSIVPLLVMPVAARLARLRGAA
jgi:succinoglycan biosynthesis protein ExoO